MQQFFPVSLLCLPFLLGSCHPVDGNKTAAVRTSFPTDSTPQSVPGVAYLTVAHGESFLSDLRDGDICKIINQAVHGSGQIVPPSRWNEFRALCTPDRLDESRNRWKILGKTTLKLRADLRIVVTFFATGESTAAFRVDSDIPCRMNGEYLCRNVSLRGGNDNLFRAWFETKEKP